MVWISGIHQALTAGDPGLQHSLLLAPTGEVFIGPTGWLGQSLAPEGLAQVRADGQSRVLAWPDIGEQLTALAPVRWSAQAGQAPWTLVLRQDPARVFALVGSTGQLYFIDLEQGLTPFIAGLFFLGFFGGNFAVFSLWLPELYDTRVRATAFAFATSFGRFVGAGINFLIGSAVLRMGTLGTPVAWTGAAFVLGLLIIPFAVETRGQALPE